MLRRLWRGERGRLDAQRLEVDSKGFIRDLEVLELQHEVRLHFVTRPIATCVWLC